MSKHEPLRLGVNLDHVATIRQARRTPYPSLLEASKLAEKAGAAGITVHLREDRRHIQDDDVQLLRNHIQGRLNLEMAATTEMVAIAARLHPAACCLVPERREELTTEGGLDVAGHLSSMISAVNTLREASIEVSLFVDPDERQIEAAYRSGAPVVELHTGSYADAAHEADRARELEKIRCAAAMAHDLGMQVNAGHGLTLDNVSAIAAIPEIVELNIGHAIVADALFVGMEQAVRRMLQIMRAARIG